MENKRDLPKRKATRLKNFDYSTVGAYFVTVCIHERAHILSEIVKSDLVHVGKEQITARGEGNSPHEITVKLKACGEIAKEQLELLETRFQGVTVENAVIMPDHIHAIVFLHKKGEVITRSPSLEDVICAFKSLTARICKEKFGIEKMFQRSFAEHIIRDRDDYETRRKYICENPMRWYYKHLNEK